MGVCVSVCVAGRRKKVTDEVFYWKDEQMCCGDGLLSVRPYSPLSGSHDSVVSTGTLGRFEEPDMIWNWSKCFPQKAHWLTFTNGQGWTRRNWPHWSFRADTNLCDWNLKRGSESLLYLLNLTMWLKWVISNSFRKCETKSAWKRVVSKLPYLTVILQSPIWIL